MATARWSLVAGHSSSQSRHASEAVEQVHDTPAWSMNGPGVAWDLLAGPWAHLEAGRASVQ